MFGASLLELFKGEPFSKAQKHHCFCGQGAGNILINQGGVLVIMGGLALEGGVSFVTLKNMFFETRTCKEIYGLVALFFCRNQECLGQVCWSCLKGSPFQKHRSTIVFVGKGLGTP